MDRAKKQRVVKKLRGVLSAADVRTSAEDLYVHSYDATAGRFEPELVVVPRTVDQLAGACEALWAESVPVTPRGAGTGYSGGALPVAGGAVIVCDRLNGWTGPTDGTVTCEPGVIVDKLNRELGRFGLFYPVDPASSDSSTVGGHIAENAGGPAALKYGVTRDNVRSLEVISPARGRETVRERPGETDLLSVIVGSEGTLAVTLRAELRVLARPAARLTALSTFEDARAAGAAAYRVITSGLGPSKTELIGADCVKCVLENDPGALPAGAGAVLLMEFDGFPEVLEKIGRDAHALVSGSGARTFTATANEAAAERLWRLRRGISPALARLGPHKLNEDVCVPPSKIPDLVEFIEDLGRELGLPVPTFGHVGDGNLHVNFIYDKADAYQAKKVEEGAGKLIEKTLELGGTISGEHGIGLSKLAFVGMELGPPEVRLMRSVKRAFDPDELLNPGKMPPAENEVSPTGEKI